MLRPLLSLDQKPSPSVLAVSSAPQIFTGNWFCARSTADVIPFTPGYPLLKMKILLGQLVTSYLPQLFSCPFLYSAPADRVDTWYDTAYRTSSVTSMSTWISLLYLHTGCQVFWLSGHTFPGEQEGCCGWPQTGSIPSGGSSLRRVGEEADMSSRGTRKQGSWGFGLWRHPRSWALQRLQQAGPVGRAFLDQIVISDNQDPLILHPGSSAAGVSFPPWHIVSTTC